MTSTLAAPSNNTTHFIVTPVPVVPAKRKRAPPGAPRQNQSVSPSVTTAPLGFFPLPSHGNAIDITTTSTSNSDSIHCICGFTYDDGFSIACDDCGRWSHALCFDIKENGVPDEWRCWLCVPRPVDKDRAMRLQKTRKKEIDAGAVGHGSSGAGGSTSGGRKRRERRASVSVMTRVASGSNGVPGAEDEHVEIDDEWKASYVHICEDNVPHRSIRDQLRQHAQSWRGVSALSPSPEPGSATTKVVPVQQDRNDPTANVRPPTYTLQTTTPIPQTTLIAPFRSTIVPSSAYLSDPLNSYAHLGMPKPHVHLMPPPLSVALDARMVGNEARFVRSGCRPNAVLRPVLCKSSKSSKATHPHLPQNGGNLTPTAPVNGVSPHPPKEATPTGPTAHVEPRPGNQTLPNGDSGSPSRSHVVESDDDSDEVDGMLSFAIFALRDIKAKEEVVLGWEWDDSAVVHHLPALIQARISEAQVFGSGGDGAGPSQMTKHHIARLRLQMQDIIHSLSSTFTTCACGSNAKDCALRLMKAFVDGDDEFLKESLEHQAVPHTPMDSRRNFKHPKGHGPPHSASPPPSLDNPPNRHPNSLTSLQALGRSKKIDLGPLIGVTRGVRTRVVGGEDGGGMSGVEMILPRGSECADHISAVAEERRPYGTWPPLSIHQQRRHPSLPEVRLQHPSPRRPQLVTSVKRSSPLHYHSGTDDEDSRLLRPILPRTPKDVLVDSPPLSPLVRREPNGCHNGIVDFARRSSSPQQSLHHHGSAEESIPPKMRKKWIRQSSSALRHNADTSTDRRVSSSSSGPDTPDEAVLNGISYDVPNCEASPPRSDTTDAQEQDQPQLMDIDPLPPTLDERHSPPPPTPASPIETPASPLEGSSPAPPCEDISSTEMQGVIGSPCDQTQPMVVVQEVDAPVDNDVPRTIAEGITHTEEGVLATPIEEVPLATPMEEIFLALPQAMEEVTPTAAADVALPIAQDVPPVLAADPTTPVMVVDVLPDITVEEPPLVHVAESQHSEFLSGEQSIGTPIVNTTTTSFGSPVSPFSEFQPPSPDFPTSPSLTIHETPKIRRSMADYIQRKKKQREVEMAAKSSVSPSIATDPVTPTPDCSHVLEPQPRSEDVGMDQLPEVKPKVIIGLGIREIQPQLLESEHPDDQASIHPICAQEPRVPSGGDPPSPTIVEPPRVELQHEEPLDAVAPALPEITVVETFVDGGNVPSEQQPNEREPRSPSVQNGGVELPLAPSTPQHDSSLAHNRATEDGEITTRTPPPFQPPSQPYRRRVASTFRPSEHRSRTPPTQPRSFHPDSPPPPPRRLPSNATYGSSYTPHQQSISSRPAPPSGPRALRDQMSTHRGSSYTPSTSIPRGPLAERDRIIDRQVHDWDRGKPAWSGPARPRGRGGWAR